MDVATFGSTCSPASAQFVKNKNAAGYETTLPRAVEGIVKCHYVDDYVDSFETEEEAQQVSVDVRMIHSQGGFNIRDWRSNSARVLEDLGQNTNPEPRTLNLEATFNKERVLGVFWLPQEDVS